MMKIFLNDRSIRFINQLPEIPGEDELAVEFDGKDHLFMAWLEFLHDDRYRKLLIIDPGYIDPEPVLPGFSIASVNGNGEQVSGEATLLQCGPAFTAMLSFFRPVEAAGGIVRSDQGDVLLIHRFGFWDLPKGKVDKADHRQAGPGKGFDNTARIAAIREVMEETGLVSVQIIRNAGYTWHVFESRGQFMIKLTRWYEMVAQGHQKLRPQASEGIFLAKWIKPTGIRNLLPHTYSSLRDLLEEYSI